MNKLASNSAFKKQRSWLLVPSLHGKYMGKKWKQWKTLFWGVSKITADGDYSHEIKKHLFVGRKAMTNLDSILKSRDIYFANKGSFSQCYGFSCSHVWTGELDHNTGWTLKNWCFCFFFFFPNLICLFIVIPKQICYDRYFLKIQLSILKTLVMQETRNLLSEDFLSTGKV